MSTTNLSERAARLLANIENHRGLYWSNWGGDGAPFRELVERGLAREVIAPNGSAYWFTSTMQTPWVDYNPYSEIGRAIWNM